LLGQVLITTHLDPFAPPESFGGIFSSPACATFCRKTTPPQPRHRSSGLFGRSPRLATATHGLTNPASARLEHSQDQAGDIVVLPGQTDKRVQG